MYVMQVNSGFNVVLLLCYCYLLHLFYVMLLLFMFFVALVCRDCSLVKDIKCMFISLIYFVLFRIVCICCSSFSLPLQFSLPFSLGVFFFCVLFFLLLLNKKLGAVLWVRCIGLRFSSFLCAWMLFRVHNDNSLNRSPTTTKWKI